MTRSLLTGWFTVMLGVLVCVPVCAQDGTGFIYLVHHRDQYGNLVSPPKSSPRKDTQKSRAQKTVIPSQPNRYVFRNSQWGMSVTEVKEHETVPLEWEVHAPVLSEGEARIGYRSTIEGIDASIGYSFENHRLVEAKYLFDSHHTDDRHYLEDYRMIQQWITQAYGSPDTEETLWLNDLYRYDPALWGRAIVHGHLTLVTEWNKEGTKIVLLLNGGGDSVGLMANFSAKTLHAPQRFVRIFSGIFDS